MKHREDIIMQIETHVGTTLMGMDISCAMEIILHRLNLYKERIEQLENPKGKTFNPDENVHLLPNKGPKHSHSSKCWCNPVFVYEDQGTMRQVWCHKFEGFEK